MWLPEFDDPKWPLMAQVARPSRYSGSEWREEPLPTDGRALKICLAFPDVYEIGMSYYGFQVLTPFLESLGVSVDRAYCPWVDMEALLRQKNTPLTSTVKRLPLGEFDAVGFTIQHELCYTNILTMLDLSNIPLRAEARGDAYPIILAGGPGAFVPEPMSPFIDAFCVGEGEAIYPKLLRALSETRGLPRSDRLEECAKVSGVYAPLYSKTRVKRQFVADLSDAPSPTNMIVPSVNIVHDRASLEVFRGCSRGCRFCQAGMTNRPVWERPAREITDTVIELVKRTGWEEVGLLSLSTCDYSAINQVVETLSPMLSARGAKLSLPSLRMDGFSVGLANRLREVRRGGLTFAPEAGTQRLRNVINKGIDEDSIFACLNEAFSKGWDRIKLYFMMGLPTETEDDLNGIVELARNAVKLAARLKRKRASLAVSVSGFVPKAHTPFQWERQNSVEEFRDKGRMLKAKVLEGKDRARSNISLAYHDPEQSFLEGALARADRRAADVIEMAWREGARFDGWSETFDLSRWLASFDSHGLDPHDFTRERREDEALPWDNIDVGVSGEFLLSERRAAYEAKLTPDCREGCSACGLDCFGAGAKK
ncbi:B12-binding domain-containing radical SAM protein [Synergistales bacterium]|nr:B12-binding domain-containing radical SAM protein [Synergistales bacterium]